MNKNQKKPCCGKKIKPIDKKILRKTNRKRKKHG